MVELLGAVWSSAIKSAARRQDHFGPSAHVSTGERTLDAADRRTCADATGGGRGLSASDSSGAEWVGRSRTCISSGVAPSVFLADGEVEAVGARATGGSER